jgi:UDP-GlcNAc:undecaprenyl-phosphate/decaprenyl-phosphate GlcNAc-1-phosphate transferase
VRGYLIVFAVGATISFLMTPPVRHAALHLGALAYPKERDVHPEPVPYGGGVAMFLAVLGGLTVAWMLPDFRELFQSSTEPLGVLGAAIILVGVGVVDDVMDISPRTKLAGQLLASGVLILGGVQIFYFWFPGLGIVSLSPDLSALLTVLWTIALINAVNLVDGLDGLAVGVTLIAAATFFIYAFAATPESHTTAELVVVLIAAACVGFLPHNFAPAKVFMGDAGSMLLGLLLASATVSGFSRTTEPQFIDVAGFIVPVLLPMFVLAIPLFDMVHAIARRLRGGHPVFHADKQHIHHRLLEVAGGAHRPAVLVMYLWSGLVAVAALVLALGPGPIWRVVALAIVGVLVASMIITPKVLQRQVLRVVPDVEPDERPGVDIG